MQRARDSSGSVITELSRLVALTPARLPDINPAIREVCAATVGLTPLPFEGTGSAVDPLITEFAEQFTADVASITKPQRDAFSDVLGRKVFGVTALIFIADFVPRVYAGLDALGIAYPDEPVDWDHDTNPAVVVLNDFAPAVDAMTALDPVTSELVRLRGARQHNCRMCRARREEAALEAGGTESMYDAIDSYETSDLAERHKVALRYVDALVWTPARVADVAPDVMAHFSQTQAEELTLDVMRNACNKIAVALGADAVS